MTKEKERLDVFITKIHWVLFGGGEREREMRSFQMVNIKLLKEEDELFFPQV